MAKASKPVNWNCRCRFDSYLGCMGIARRQRRQFERAWKKQSKKASTPITLKDNVGLQELVNNLTKEYEASTSNK